MTLHLGFLPAPNMADFYVLGSDVGFPTSPPGSLKGHAGYKLCGQYPGTPPLGQISRITCVPGPSPAKYIYIQADVPTQRNFLELCEVWVYGSKFSKSNCSAIINFYLYIYMMKDCIIISMFNLRQTISVDIISDMIYDVFYKNIEYRYTYMARNSPWGLCLLNQLSSHL